MMRVSTWLIAIAAGIGMLGTPAAPTWAAESEGPKFTDTFFEDKADLVSTGKNPFFILEPGYILYFQGQEGGKEADLTITVLGETKNVDGVETRIVEERETNDGKVVEVSRNYFAISKRTNSVYYFGEETCHPKATGGFTIGGDSWEAGKKGAKYGLMMPGSPLLGERYYQEVAEGVAMDRAENASVSDALEVPAGKFKNVLKTEETTPLEKGKAYKYYAAGVGLLKDGALSLVRYGKGDAKAPEAGAKPAKGSKGKASAAAQETKASVPASELPAAITKAIAEAFPKGEIVEVQREVSGENPGQYDVTVRSGGKEIDVEISPEGKVLESKPKGK